MLHLDRLFSEENCTRYICRRVVAAPFRVLCHKWYNTVMRRFLSLSLALWLMWAWADAPAWISRAETITPIDLRAHLEFIASDELEGRDTPSRGLDLAGMYIVSHLQRWGVKPAGENGTYYQTLRFRTDSLNPAESRIRIGGQSFEYGVGFVARPVAVERNCAAGLCRQRLVEPRQGHRPLRGAGSGRARCWWCRQATRRRSSSRGSTLRRPLAGARPNRTPKRRAHWQSCASTRRIWSASNASPARGASGALWKA
jgi:hypothetical protein